MEIPNSHLHLLTDPIHAILTTIMSDGQPQSSIVWCGHDNGLVLISTTLERQKGKNIRNNPKVSVLILEPENANRFLSIRGDVIEITENNAIEFADKLTREYTSKKKYYGEIFPREQQNKETRVIIKIKPKRINIDAIHN